MTEKVKQMIINAKESRDLCSTWYFDLGYTEGKKRNYRWAIVVAWMPGYEVDEEDEWTVKEGNDTYCLCGKVAYQPTNSLMQEYDIDWTMPCFKDNKEVDDTELTLYSPNNAEYFLKEWNYIKEHLDEVVPWEETEEETA